MPKTNKLIQFKQWILRIVRRSYLDELLKQDLEKYEWNTKYYDPPKTIKERWKRFWRGQQQNWSRREPDKVGF